MGYAVIVMAVMDLVPIVIGVVNAAMKTKKQRNCRQRPERPVVCD